MTIILESKTIRKNQSLFCIILILIFQNVCSETTFCPSATPILRSGICSLEFCTEQEYSEKVCEIANPKVETQWINNFITFASVNYRCLSISSFSSGDMIIATTNAPTSSIRAFYGLKRNGRPYFRDKATLEETSTYYIDSEKENSQYQIESAIIKSSEPINKGKEYFFTFSKAEGNAEIADFENDKIYSKLVTEFSGDISVKTYRHAIILLDSNDNEYSYMIAFMDYSDAGHVYFKKYIFSSIENLDGMKPGGFEIEKGFGSEISCFKTTSEKIICFFLTNNNGKKFNVYRFDKNFENKVSETFTSNLNEDKLFIKCIHLKENVGVFSSFHQYTTGVYPFFIFKELKDNEFVNYLSSDYPDSKIIIEKNNFKNNLAYCDLIKINDNKIVFVTCSTEKEILYIIVFNIFGENLVKIRYYSIQLWALYGKKLLKDLRIHNYNNYLVCAISYCNNTACDQDTDEHYPGLMIFSYPNINDKTLSIEDYIYNDNTLDPFNFKWDISKQLIIQNNIFAYVLNATYIVKIEGPSLEYLSYSSKDEAIEIKENYLMEKDECMKFKYIGEGSFLPQINKTIEYYYIATEPDYDISDAYADETWGYDYSEADLPKNQYIGRLSYYYIQLNNELSLNSCTDPNCKICKKNSPTYCLTCLYNFTFSETIGKICFEPELIPTTIITTEPHTEALTEPPTEPPTQPPTEPPTEPQTYPPTESPTEEYSEQITEQTIMKSFDSMSELIENKTDEIIQTYSEETINDENNCFENDILNNKCSQGHLNEEQVNKLYTQIKDNYLNTDYKGNNTIIQTQNVVIQISNLEDQKNSDNPNVSSIDLGQCEQELKSHYGITEDLIVFKIDMKSEDLTQTYVQYEIYDPRNFTVLNLSVCKDMKISVSTPVKLDSSISDLYDILKDSGYDLFNDSDPFYTDICSTFTSANGTDMTLSDRKQEIYSTSGNLTLCQSGCELEYYNSTSKKAKCQCSPQEEKTEPILSISSSKFNVKKLSDSFMSTLKNSNFLVLKCYKLAFNFKTFLSNIGRIVMTAVLFVSLIFFIYFCIGDKKKIDNVLQSIIKKKIKQKSRNKNITEGNNKNSLKENKKSGLERSKTNDRTKKSENKKFFKSKKTIQPKSRPQSNIHSKNTLKSGPPKKNIITNKRKKMHSSYTMNSKAVLDEESNNQNLKAKKDRKLGKNVNILKINTYNIKNVIRENNKKNKQAKKNSFKTTKDNLIMKSKTKTNTNANTKKGQQPYNSSENNFNLKTSKKDNNIGKKPQLKKENLNDEELNNLEYSLALIVDKRSYFQYYWSLLKKKQLIFFTFLPADDYNLLSIKILLFLLSFSLYFAINAFFFSDDTMHKIHEDNGKFNIIYQIPQILYSSIICAIINMVLKYLSLSEKNIIKFKKENDINTMKIVGKRIEKCILIKLGIFFLINSIFLLFFWYYISCFCAVYKNTQIILIKDTFSSFGLSMLYPFGLNLLAGLFRIPALRAKNKDKKCLYQISTYVALI